MTGEDSTADALDRTAVEGTRGGRLPRDWPPEALKQGTPVRVVHDAQWAGPWRRDFTGVISGLAAPEPVVSSVAHPGELSYWVDFDEPQVDQGGDGPYRRAQIWDRYLEVVEGGDPNPGFERPPSPNDRNL